ncbi:Histone-lysine N-methyltransferase, H3 lysine-36 specific [Gracilariopsis chorda]|uniref:Histone-lysine N-methyltransferase, H3 lysine-36 specific n=1 Tax=Gracilariopsis chorda TaxID=448386 RepID=A0A2V3IDZ4_9FLOR|nr:Histone-lysine N-methyltransferase, H3 lysine-36 specific [Gracilariopsis chorda]|eukprot:PXF40272.1 Histone-lysine N-methyltransferase, H3 lysine-36 specific [Gracilariopsis chorda]
MTSGITLVTPRHDEKKGLVLVADQHIRRGAVIIEEQAEILDRASMHSVQYTPSKHAHTFEGGILKLAEHMCEPNCGIAIVPVAADSSNAERVLVKLVALRNISGGESVGFNYNTSDWCFSHPFQCECGANSCTGLIGGFSKLTSKQQQSLFELFDAPYIAEGVLGNLDSQENVMQE